MSTMRLWKNLLLAGIVLLMCSGTAFPYCSSQYSCEDENGYSDADSHPLRIIAYALHPIGFAAEWLVSRPIHALVSQPIACPLFGYAPDRWGCEEELRLSAPRAAMTVVAPPVTPVAPTAAVSSADLEAMRRAVDEAKQAAQEAKRAAEEAAQAAERSTKAFEKQLQK